MPNWPATAWIHRYRSAARGFAAIVVGGSLLVLIGWAFDVPALKGIAVGLATMKVNTALGLMFGGLAALLSLPVPQPGGRRIAASIAAAATTAIGLLTLLEYAFGRNLGIDELLILDPTPITGTSFPGRPAPATAFLFVLIGASCLAAGWRRLALLSQLLAIVAAIIAYLILAGYIYGASSLYSAGFFSSVALHTAVLVLLLCLALMGLTAGVGLMSLVCSDEAGGVMARRLLPIVFILPVTLGWIRLQGQRYGLYEREFGSAIFATSNVLIFSGVTLWTARVLSLFDAERRAAERRFELAVEVAPNAMLMVDSRDRIVMVNSHVEKLFGYPRDALVGKPFDSLLPERFHDVHDIGSSGVAAKSMTDSSSVSIAQSRELYGRRADGSEFPIEIGLRRTESHGETWNLIAIIDLTARTRLEEQRRFHLAELAHASRLSTVGQMMSELAHELNQPLAASANYARACANMKRTQGETAAAEIGEMMEKSLFQTNRAIDIVKRISAFAKKETGVWSPINVNRLVESVVTLTIPTMQGARGALHHVTPKTQLDGSIPDIYADRVQIEQVLVNLIRNAVEAMQEPNCKNRSLLIATKKRNDEIEVSVRDHGAGISKEDLPRLFAPYFTTKSDGMGLGLSISRSIIEEHQGQMTVESSPAGTEFRFTLPIAGPPPKVTRA